jgi:tetratricopeptide (TPR) repeat protein
MAKHSVLRKVALVLLPSLCFQISTGSARGQETISAGLARAESLYYGAQFQSALGVLLDLETRLQNDPRSAEERLKVKLYLALTHLALNETAQAKSNFVGVCRIDRNYTLDRAEFPPKVTSLFEEARADCAENTCSEICSREPSVADFESGRHGCSCPAPAATVREQFEQGQELYRNGKFAEASTQFAAVLALDNSNELAAEYLKLSKQQQELNISLAFSEWRENFDKRQYDKAADAYQRLRHSMVGPTATEYADQAEYEYGKAFQNLVKLSRAACEAGDAPRVAAIRREATSVDSGLKLVDGSLVEMDRCVPRKCMQGDPVLALNRAKTPIRLEIEPSLERYVTRGIRIGIEIDESGKVKLKQITNANPRLAEALKSAVEQWSFYPALVNNRATCVETEIPIALIQF